MEIAEEITRENPGLEIKVLSLPIPVAALMTSDYLKRELPRYSELLRNSDIVIVPGLTRGDLRELSESIGVKIVKGTRYASDLPLMIKMLLEGREFSTSKPADLVIEEKRSEIDLGILRELRDLSRREYFFKIRDISISRHYPLVVLELYIEEEDDVEKYSEAVKYSDLVSIGFTQNTDLPEARRILEYVKDTYGKPVGIDTPETSLVEKLITEIDFVNGIVVEKIDEVIKVLVEYPDKPVILTSHSVDPYERLGNIEKTLIKISEFDVDKVVVDPVLSPPFHGLVESIDTYLLARKKFPDKPLLMGIGNVTELVDVDSHGLNALLVFMGVEIGVELFLTTEYSYKTRGSTREVKRSIDMAILAKRLNRPPKDLSVNLLILKDKRKIDQPVVRAGNVVWASDEYKWGPDPAGFFKILHDGREIIVQHYRPGSMEPDIEIRGVKPYSILAEITRRGLVSTPEHYFYLGYELSKAYIALRLGKNYIQESELFNV